MYNKSLSLLLVILIFWCPLRCLGAGCPCGSGSNLQEVTGVDEIGSISILPCCCDDRPPTTAGNQLSGRWNLPVAPLGSGQQGQKCPCENCQCSCSGATLSVHFILHVETVRQFLGQYKDLGAIMARTGTSDIDQLERNKPRSNFLHASKTGRQIRCVLESFLI